MLILKHPNFSMGIFKIFLCEMSKSGFTIALRLPKENG